MVAQRCAPIGHDCAVRGFGVGYAQAETGAARAMCFGKITGERIRRFIDQKVDPALAIERDGKLFMPGDGGEAQIAEQGMQLLRFRGSKFNQFKL